MFRYIPIWIPIFHAVADPGFPRGRGNLEGAPTCYLNYFFWTLHEKKDILAESGRLLRTLHLPMLCRHVAKPSQISTTTLNTITPATTCVGTCLYFWNRTRRNYQGERQLRRVSEFMRACGSLWSISGLLLQMDYQILNRFMCCYVSKWETVCNYIPFPVELG